MPIISVARFTLVFFTQSIEISHLPRATIRDRYTLFRHSVICHSGVNSISNKPVPSWCLTVHAQVTKVWSHHSMNGRLANEFSPSARTLWHIHSTPKRHTVIFVMTESESPSAFGQLANVDCNSHTKRKLFQIKNKIRSFWSTAVFTVQQWQHSFDISRKAFTHTWSNILKIACRQIPGKFSLIIFYKRMFLVGFEFVHYRIHFVVVDVELSSIRLQSLSRIYLHLSFFLFLSIVGFSFNRVRI